MKDRKEKIKWYEEVLEIEPASRVFFPLARLLAEEGENAKAISVLRKGLAQHPDFFEARLMLVDLAQKTGGIGEVVSEISALGENLCSYPGFWEAWAAHAERKGDDRSLVFALRFLAVHLKNRDLSLLDVLEKGVTEILSAEQDATEIRQPAKSGQGVPVSARAAVLEDAVALENLGRESLMEAGALRAQADQAQLAAPVRAVRKPAAREDDAGEAYSLRTRTMAALLAEQGDYQGALDIYNELLREAADAGQRAELEMCVRGVQARMKNASGAAAGDAAETAQLSAGSAPSADNRHRIVRTLEMLARRLEARAGA